jgi:hypothetical protein
MEELLAKLHEAGWVLGVLALAFAVIYVVNRLFNTLKKRVISNRHDISEGWHLNKHQILDAHQVAEILILGINILEAV